MDETKPNDEPGVIHYRTESEIPWGDRLRILFGQPIIIDSDIMVNREVEILDSMAVLHVTRFFNDKPVQLKVSTPDNQSTNQ